MDQTQEQEAVINNADEVQTPESTSPVDTEQTPLESDISTDDSASDEEVQTENDYQDELDSLPQEQSEQAKAFQKLRLERKKLLDENNQLKQGLTDRKARQSSFEQLKAPQSDIDQTVEYKLDEIKAKELYPQLDTQSDKFDPDFEEEVAGLYFFNLYQGRQVKISELAKRLSEKRGLPKAELKKVEAEVTQKVRQGITAKEQASLSAAGRSQPGYSSAQSHQSLVERSRAGDNDAIAERLKRV